MYPLTVEVLAVQVSVTECEAGCTPVPESVIVAGELVALLVTVTLPGSEPALDGVKVTFSVAVVPAATIWPEETPLAVYPAPEMVTLETVTLEFPPLVKVTERLLLLPMLTVEKFKAVVLGVSCMVEAVTVRVAALLVTLPPALLTVTVNCEPLFAVVVAEVEYEVEVAPLIGAPFKFH